MVPIELNHIWTVVDKSTYNTIKNSEFFPLFAYSYEQKNTADEQTSWEGFYIRGKHTYLEIFYPQERYKFIGLAGIGLGCDNQGDLRKFFNESFGKRYANAQYNTFKRQGVPWFDYVAVNGSYYGKGHSFWIMEYAPTTFTENETDISRLHYNARTFDPRKPLLDIIGFSLALNATDQGTILDYFASVSMHSPSNNVYETKSGVKIEITNETQTQKGIHEIKFSLSNPSFTTEKIVLGNSEIIFNPNQAIWRFFTKNE